MPHPFSRYRLRFFKDVVRILVLPSVCFSGLLWITHVRLGLLAVPCHVAFIAVAACVRNWYYDFQDCRAAQQMNARVVPTVKGKWPGNLDILLKFKQATASEYLGDFFLQLFEEHQSTIVNLRMLGANLVGLIIRSSSTRASLERPHAPFIWALMCVPAEQLLLT